MDLIYANDFVTAAMALRRNGIGPDVLRIIRGFLPPAIRNAIIDMFSKDGDVHGIDIRMNGEDLGVLLVQICDVYDEEEEEYVPTPTFWYTYYELKNWTSRDYWCEYCDDTGRIELDEDEIDGYESDRFSRWLLERCGCNGVRVGGTGLFLERSWYFSHAEGEWLFEPDELILTSPESRRLLDLSKQFR